jgi:hypothetical protein
MKKLILAAGFSTLSTFALIGLTGCGGSSVSPTNPSGPSAPITRGSAAFNIRWPERTSTRPQDANSILIVVKDSNGTQVDRRIISRPTGDSLDTHVEFSNLEPGLRTFSVSAHPGISADGVAQAKGEVALLVESGKTATARLTLGSTVDRIVLSQTSVDIRPGRVIQVIATPYDIDGNIVLVKSAFQWVSSNPSVVTILATAGVANFTPGGNSGTTTVTARDSESGKSATCAVNNRVGTSNLDYATYVQIETVVDETAKIIIDGNDADWNKIPSYADTADAAPAALNITSSSVVATSDAFYVRLRTAGPPSTTATKTYWIGLDIANTYHTADIEIGFSSDGKKTQIRTIAADGATQLSGEFDLVDPNPNIPLVKYGSVIEAKIPYALLKTALPVTLANALDNLRPMVRMSSWTVDATTNPATLADRGALAGTYLIKATPFSLDPPAPANGTAPRSLRVPGNGRWYIGQGGFSGSNGVGNGGIGAHTGFWAYDLDVRDVSGIRSNPDNSVTSANYFSWNQNVISPIGGTVLAVNAGADDIAALGTPPTSQALNRLYLDLGGNLALQINHFQKNTLTPTVGQSINEGDTVGRVGNNGWNLWPMIHLQLEDKNSNGAVTYPIAFKSVRICLSPAAIDPWERKRADWDAREGFYIEKQ